MAGELNIPRDVKPDFWQAAIRRAQIHGCWKEFGRMGQKIDLHRVWKVQGWSKFGSCIIKASRASGSEMASRRSCGEEKGAKLH